MDERTLAAALRDALGPVTIENLTRLSGGASRETWAFDAVGTGGSAPNWCCAVTRRGAQASRER